MTTQPVEEDGAVKPKRMDPRRLRQTMYWLALDWIHLQEMSPVVSVQRFGEVVRSSNVKDYGHPQEWASDTARDIVEKLTCWHDFMAEYRNETRPRRKRMRINDDGADIWVYAVNDQQRLVAAWKYLEPRCEQLVDLVELEALKELPDLHHTIRSVLGQYVPKYTIPVPCPSVDCGLRTLLRVMGVGQDFITCDACGYTIKDSYYPLLVRMTLDAFVSTHPEKPNCTGTVDTTDTGVSNPPVRKPQSHRHWGFFA